MEKRVLPGFSVLFCQNSFIPPYVQTLQRPLLGCVFSGELLPKPAPGQSYRLEGAIQPDQCKRPEHLWNLGAGRQCHYGWE